MLTMLRHTFRLMAAQDRSHLVVLVPLMVAASLSDIVTVYSASTFLKWLTAPAGDAEATLRAWGVDGLLDATSAGVLFALGLLAVVLLSNALTVYATYAINAFGFQQVIHLSEKVFLSILSREYPWFLQQNTAQLKQKTLIETHRMVEVLIVETIQIGARLLGAVAIVLYLLAQDVVFTLMLGLSTSAFYGGLFLFIRRRMRVYGQQRASMDRLRHRLVEESFVGVKELKLHGLEREALRRFHEPNVVYAHALVMVRTVTNLAKPALEVVGITGLVVLVLAFLVVGRPLGGVLALLGTYAIGAYRLLPTVQRVFVWGMRAQAEKVALDIVLEEVDVEPLQLEGVPTILLERAIALEQIRFSYPGTSRLVLDGIDLTVPKGTWIALVGSTGSGKTTLVDVMMGLLQPDEGQVRIDDTVLHTREQIKRWQERIGYVPQTLFMSDATVAENIAFGEDEPDMERVEAAARMACAHGFIEKLPQGYATPIGERGMRLSGGQRQRIGIARALYRRPDLLVLDEATSALDNRTEAAVMDALRAHFADTTVVMIAHRLSTTRHCDQIWLLEGGRVLDTGSYEELLERSRYFRQLVEASQDDGVTPRRRRGASDSGSLERLEGQGDPEPDHRGGTT